MPITWNAQADARLLVAIMRTAPKIDLKAVAEYMGDDVTEYALQHRFRKLKKLADGDGGEAGSAPTTPSKSPKTPVKSRSAVSKSTPSTSARKRKAVVKPDMDEDESVVKEEPANKKIKAENADDDAAFI
ncbi:predicted protein [Uncinocarpus reesii 1704]|uniref:Uncharacterized protein n=1 Tax=Uncinocarpus reesii (strain UAMH 1704) TaxID=336963 RepID=C4JMS1_UNCRE|nr:uncharacterized protein UREG_04129 [Uncinocarpus reesii 1704]EEP79283.1 predicted protein [Uncinocarpus reesii 1704]